MATFYENFLKLCNERNKKPSRAALDMGISKTAVTRWKQGYHPTDVNLQKIADYFGVSMKYLTGETESSAVDSDKERSSCDNKTSVNSNIIKIAGRDGSFSERILTDDQLDLIRKMIEQMPDANDL